MPKKSLSLILIPAIIANLVVICVGHSHGSHESASQTNHVHIFGHEHGRHDQHSHGERDHANGNSLPEIAQHSPDHEADVVYLVDFDWRSENGSKEVKDTKDKVVCFGSEFSGSYSNSSGLESLTTPCVFAPAHFLNTVRFLL